MKKVHRNRQLIRQLLRDKNWRLVQKRPNEFIRLLRSRRHLAEMLNYNLLLVNE